ncbi:AraC family transcriptional regulator [Nonomuraea sp. SMC257]|uniref:AraC family transcriptional regulator n=1 Tax=Nonomuraea montanisoli TaxID=2741721 RepID=A0A7Y6I9A0_9ACTN|nr:AraC family transcriptional regulator [Nonomuraea montanisoli]NUW33518.1 AraC family transcriptional regulator [Nonomuraea montanisoli]
MDLLEDYLAGVRAHGAVFCQSVAEPPWAVRYADPAPLALGAMLRGESWIVRDGTAPVQVGERGVVLVRGLRPFTVADRPGTEPQVVIDGEESCWTTVGASGAAGPELVVGPRTYGFSADGSDLFVTAEYPLRGDVSERLLRALPEVAVIPPDPEFAPLLDLLAVEIGRDEPGQQVILDRLLDLLLVRALRSWFARPDVEAPPGYRALADPRIGRALRLMHERPAHPWTVAALGTEVGMSRAVFARRFAELVGQPPLVYLTEWRMTVAADLLRKPGTTVAAVARRVGYADGFAFSNAFKRVRGMPPSELVRSAR